MILNGFVQSIGLGESQNWQCIELKYTAAAAGTAWSLIPEQATAARRVLAITGNAAADLLTNAQATALVSNPAGSVRLARATELAAIAAKLVTYFTAVPAAADAAKCLAFVVGGLTGLGRVLCAELEWGGVSSAAANFGPRLRTNGPATVCTSASSPTVSANSLVAFPEAGVVGGVFAIPDVLDVPGAGAPVTLKLWIRP